VARPPQTETDGAPAGRPVVSLMSASGPAAARSTSGLTAVPSAPHSLPTPSPAPRWPGPGWFRTGASSGTTAGSTEPSVPAARPSSTPGRSWAARTRRTNRRGAAPPKGGPLLSSRRATGHPRAPRRFVFARRESSGLNGARHPC